MNLTSDDRRRDTPLGPGLGPPRFRLLTLLGMVTAFSVVLATYTGFGGFAAAIVGLFLLAVFAHIAGNWLGNQLRDLGNQSRAAAESGEDGEAPRRRVGEVRAHEFAVSSDLGAQQPIAGWVKVSVLVGAILGSLVGLGSQFVGNVESINVLSLIFGSVAFGVLGAIWSFAFGAFLHVGWTAWRQAARGENQK